MPKSPTCSTPVEARAESHLECEHVVVEALDRTVNITRRADQHGHTSQCSPLLLSEGYILRKMCQYSLVTTPVE